MSGADKGPAPSADQLPISYKHANEVGSKYAAQYVNAALGAKFLSFAQSDLNAKSLTPAYNEGARDAFHGNTYN